MQGSIVLLQRCVGSNGDERLCAMGGSPALAFGGPVRGSWLTCSPACKAGRAAHGTRLVRRGLTEYWALLPVAPTVTIPETLRLFSSLRSHTAGGTDSADCAIRAVMILSITPVCVAVIAPWALRLC